MTVPNVILFDLMDTVVYDPYREALAHALEGLDREWIRKARSPTSWHRFERGEISEQEFEAQFFDPSHCQQGERFALARFNKVRTEGYKLLDGIDSLLDTLSQHNVACHIASNYPVWIYGLVSQLNLQRWFRTVQASCELGVRKPDPAFFQAILNRLDVAPESCLFVDDREDNCIGAREVGIRSLLFTNALTLQSDLSTLGVISHRL